MRVILAFLLSLAARSQCPFQGVPPEGHPRVPPPYPKPSPSFAEKLASVDFNAVKEDLKKLFVDSKEQWPADYGNYGPFFVRLAWHCSGSYRTSDGRGGCDGGRQRFDPERSWDDNTNLDKARGLLWPIKEKYGEGLSFGDLFILAGTTAIEAMGGPVLGFCAGRIDDPNGEASLGLGPSMEQADQAPCKVNGKCKEPLGSTTVGLIYLNPEGPMGRPVPSKSSYDVRDAFARMAMNDSETVALIGGGHAFGKTHGACTTGPGPNPAADPANPWPGTCGTGKGTDAWTSGFEGPWTTNPTKWDNEYFNNLLNYKWSHWKGPGGRYQWQVVNGTNPVAPGAGGGQQKTMMMTSDISLTKDPTGKFQKLVRLFASDANAFDNAFAHAWYKLVTRDMGPVTRCFGDMVPPAQPWQNPLPPPPSKLANFTEVSSEIDRLMNNCGSDTTPIFVRLAWRCSATFRVTDYRGGCNGGRIRHSPEKNWPINAGLNRALEMLEHVKDMFGESLSWADLIVLAGNAAIVKSGGRPMSFCGGRSDANDGTGSKHLEPWITGNVTDGIEKLKYWIRTIGLSYREMTALMGGGHSLGMMHTDRSGYTGSWTSDPTTISNDYFKTLINEQWEAYTVSSTGNKQYKAKGKELYMLQTDIIFKIDPELMAIATEYASDNEGFLMEFANAWTRLTNIDRYDGPTGNVCDSSNRKRNKNDSVNRLISKLMLME